MRRRDPLRLGAISATAAALPKSAHATSRAADCQANLYDATRCIGCRACQTACRENAGLPPTPSPERLYDQPTNLSARTLSIIRSYRDDGAGKASFVKRQCMHCLDPACASACPVEALRRNSRGIVEYREERCIGCRYCMMACPFDVPKFEYDQAVPAIVKCNFCAERTGAGRPPSCTSACPTEALTFGSRVELLAEAHHRIATNPGRYIDHVYGEDEVGGTAMLYLAGVEFAKLGLPTLGAGAYPELTRGFLNWVPLVIIGGTTLLTGLRWTVQHRDAAAGEGEGDDD